MRALTYQLYSSRNFGPLERTLEMVSTTGFKSIEGYGGVFDGVDPHDLKAAMDARGLHMPSAHFGVGMIETDVAAVIETATVLDLSHIFIPFVPPAERPKGMADWVAFGRHLSELGKPLVDAGFGFGWHNHDFEFQPIDGGFPIDGLFEGGPGLAFEFDIAWATRAGQDPLFWITRFADRIAAAHVKDIAPTGENVDEDGWADVGEGTIDWKACLTGLDDIGCNLLIVEHDNPADDARFARRSLTNIQAL